MKTNNYRIKADYNYYSGTLNYPANGYVMGEEKYDSWTDKTTREPLGFESIRDAYDHLTSGDYGDHPSDGLACEYDGDGNFSVAGTYVTHHGQDSRRVYQIVNAKSGRCNKAIIAAIGDEKTTTKK